MDRICSFSWKSQSVGSSTVEDSLFLGPIKIGLGLFTPNSNRLIGIHSITWSAQIGSASDTNKMHPNDLSADTIPLPTSPYPHTRALLPQSKVSVALWKKNHCHMVREYIYVESNHYNFSKDELTNWCLCVLWNLKFHVHRYLYR